MFKQSRHIFPLLFCSLALVQAPGFCEAGRPFGAILPKPCQTQLNHDYKVVPGKSCGKIKLGMSKEEVLGLLGFPCQKPTCDSKNDPEVWIYTARLNWLHIFFAANKVVQIDFTSPAFKTEDGYATDLKTVESNDRFSHYEIPWRFHHSRFVYKKGGLSFYVINEDSGDAEYEITRVGSVFKGSRPVTEAFGLSQEPNNGWSPCGKPRSGPLVTYKFAANSTMEKDLGSGFTYRQRTDACGVVYLAQVLKGKKIVYELYPDNASITPAFADSRGLPVAKDLDGDRVPDLALLCAEGPDPAYRLQVVALKGDKLENKYFEQFYEGKPLVLPAVKPGQPGVIATDATYRDSFGDEANSPLPLVKLRWFNKYPFTLAMDEMKKPPLTDEEINARVLILSGKAYSKDGVFQITQPLLQSVYDLVYCGRADDARKIIVQLWPEHEKGCWSGGPLIDRRQFWLEVTERILDSPYRDEILKMNGNLASLQSAVN